MRYFAFDEKLYNKVIDALSPKIINNLKIHLDTVVYDNQDIVLLLDGKEGAGKSVTARLVAYFCMCYLTTYNIYINLSVDDIHFKLTSYVKSSISSGKMGGKGHINILDEARNVLNKRKAMAGALNLFVDFLSECRSLNQVHIICVPASHDLDKNIILWRMKFLLHMHVFFIPCSTEQRQSGMKMIKGDYSLFSPGEMTPYYTETAKYGNYNYPRQNKKNFKPNSDGHISYLDIFTPEQEKEYNAKKEFNMDDKYTKKIETIEEKEKNQKEEDVDIMKQIYNDLKKVNQHL